MSVSGRVINQAASNANAKQPTKDLCLQIIGRIIQRKCTHVRGIAKVLISHHQFSSCNNFF